MSKQKSTPVSKEEYAKKYCAEKIVRHRRVIYVSDKTHSVLRKITYMFGEHYTTTTSLVEAIINHHFEDHKDFLNQSYKEYNENF